MSSKQITQVGLASLLVLLFGLAIYFSSRGPSSPFLADAPDNTAAENQPERPPRPANAGPLSDGRDVAEGHVVLGGVERSDSDIEGDDGAQVGEVDNPDDPLEGTIFDYGETPGVPVDANEQVALAVEAFRTGRYPERLNAGLASPSARSFDPRKFDTESELHDPEYREAYVRTPEPGRVWHPAQPGPGVPRIRPLMPTFTKVKQGEDIQLRVSGQPGQPVTFTSFDLGMFENQLTTITVVADDIGVARTQFRGPPGTVDDVNIMAASPVMSGQVRLTVHVIGPNDPGFSED